MKRLPRIDQYERLHLLGWASRGHLWYHADFGWGIPVELAIIATCKGVKR